MAGARGLHRHTYADYVALDRRGDDGQWLTRVAIAGGRLVVDTVGAEIFVDEIYRSSAIEH